MKSDSTEKSEIKSNVEIKTSDKKNLKKDINQKSSLENQVTPIENIKDDLHSLDLDEYPTYLDKLLKQSDWIKQNDRVNILSLIHI